MCYTIYLWHDPLLAWTAHWFAAVVPRELPFALQGLIANAISISAVTAICAVLFYYTERPFMGNRVPAWIGEKWRRIRVREVAAEAAQS